MSLHSNNRQHAASVLAFLPIALLVFAQGGFFGLAPCFIGAVTCVVACVLWLRKPRRSSPVPIVALLWCVFALVYVVSAVASGVTLTTLTEAGTWGACAAFSLIVAAQSTQGRTRSLGMLTWFGVLTAVLGALVACGLLPMAGGMVNGRLQFSFQYANAAAAWFGTCTLLCLLSPSDRQRSFVALPAAALLLTQSGGALLVFVIAAVVLGVRWVRSGEWDLLRDALLQAVLSMVLFAIMRGLGGIVGLVALVAVFVACLFFSRGWHPLDGRVGAKRVSLVLSALVAVAVVAAGVLMGSRVTAAWASAHERVYHMADGLRLWWSAPLLGVGPNNWQYLYQYVQSAPYYTSVVHSSLVQFMVDAGMLGLGTFVATCFFGLRGLVRNMWRTSAKLDARSTDAVPDWSHALLWSALFLVAHSVLEFDLQFASLAFMLAFLLGGEGERANEIEGEADLAALPTGPAAWLDGKVAAALCLLVLLPACLAGALCAATSTAMASANTRGDYAVCERLFESSALARADVAAQSEYIDALYAQERYDHVIDAYQRMAAPTDRDATYAAIACYKRTRPAEAVTIMVERLEAQPYNAEFCDTATQLTSTFGGDPSLDARMSVAIDRVRQNIARYEGAD